jgi:hypothetical protein
VLSLPITTFRLIDDGSLHALSASTIAVAAIVAGARWDDLSDERRIRRVPFAISGLQAAITPAIANPIRFFLFLWRSMPL